MSKKLSLLLSTLLVLGITGTAVAGVLQAGEPNLRFEEEFDAEAGTLEFSLWDLEADEELVPPTMVEVEGPDGQVNHGQVVSSFRHALKEAGIRGGGCLNRVIAQSDYGKPAEEADEPVAGVNSHEISCKVNEQGEKSNNGEGKGNGPPEHANRPEHAGRPDHAGSPHDDA